MRSVTNMTRQDWRDFIIQRAAEASERNKRMREFLAKFGAEQFTASPAETKKLVDKEIADWDNYVKLAKIEAQ